MKTFRSIAAGFLCIALVLVAGKSSAQAKATTAIQGTYKTIYDMLRDVPGLEVKTSNGRGNSVIVRGISTLTGSSVPLFVVDGTIYSGDISNLNVQDIESVNVLKDAASLTAYGTQGANGVIQITTKKGSNASSAASVSSHTESAYTYFIDKKTPLRVYGHDDKVIIEGVIEKQRGDSLIFIKRRKDFPVAISSVKRVEMIPQN
ncbi:TonB-dependent receptor plug domain-containing protein [Sediminibacterium roseum]|uniref:TonB-dependent receptor plug domain-containing protein n=1 Tax=Sediminibacterium roseum TaxID=1978412 RepID=A0ABW9ZVB4_9BACT|nr:TonB-dependent receptor plug domain-containing protein [Sediminibacterium roseum]NCI49677.1 TonB-dependent receptor plug domain-containing protein [Sediminibacterium roseum]